METRRPILDALNPAVLNVSFSADNTCFAVAIENGFKIYTTSDCELRDGRDTEDGIAIVEMLGTTRYIALVGGGKLPKWPPNKVLALLNPKHTGVKADVARRSLSGANALDDLFRRCPSHLL